MDTTFSQADREETKKPKILLVEDEPIAQKVNIKLLISIGCDVDLAENGKQALEKSINGYDLIFMDMGLPDLKGSEVVKIIRDRENGKARAPIIFLTAYTQEEIKKECLEAGANDVYTKPISIEKLKEIITQYVL